MMCRLRIWSSYVELKMIQVIQISGCKGALSTNKAIHQPLKPPWRSVETKWQDIKFEEPKWRTDGRLVLVLASHRYILASTSL